MTHPLFSALDAAIAAHGWPDGVKFIGINPPAACPTSFATVVAGQFLSADSGRGAADTFADAADLAFAGLSEQEAARRALRKLAAEHGISAEFIK